MTIECNNCGKENEPDNSFCGGCGSDLKAEIEIDSSDFSTDELLCSRCGSKMPPAASFCGICGSSLAAKPKKRDSAPLPSTIDEPPQRIELVRKSPDDTKNTDDSPTVPEPFPTSEASSGFMGEHPFRTSSSLREMVVIPAGRFWMGSPADHGNRDESPRHKVPLGRFQIDRFAVSNLEYEIFDSDHARHRTATCNRDLDPVVFVSHEQCLQYCEWRCEQEGLPSGTYRLPTEAQWEYSARGGQENTFPWGDDVTDGVCNTREAGLGRAVPVDEGLPNGYNLLHMGSNVREWCADWYNEAYYTLEASSESDPQGPPPMDFVNMKVVRGASFQDLASELSRCAARNYAHPKSQSDNVGFRCVRDG